MAEQEGATPPGEGRQTHDTVTQVPKAPRPGPDSETFPGERAAGDQREPIPGERETDTLTKSARGFWTGAGQPPSDLSQTLGDETAREHRIEGGGGDGRSK